MFNFGNGTVVATVLGVFASTALEHSATDTASKPPKIRDDSVVIRWHLFDGFMTIPIDTYRQS
jgi:hypothetical protein